MKNVECVLFCYLVWGQLLINRIVLGVRKGGVKGFLGNIDKVELFFFYCVGLERE